MILGPTGSMVSVEWWSVPVSDIFSNEDMRLDAERFNPAVSNAIQRLRESGVELVALSELASVELRSQFTRIWALDPEYGLPYLNATDLLSLFTLGVPASASGPRYLSYATDTDLDRLVVREDWLLMTCSGTIGRVFYVPKRLDGWAATHDLVRIVPRDDGMIGYLYAWLSTPIARSQVLSYTHGGQIDHVTDAQVAGILVPVLPRERIEQINREALSALRARESAMETLMNVWSAI